MPRPAQPTPGSGPPDSVHRQSPKPVAADVVQVDVLAFFAKRVEHGLLGQPAQAAAASNRPSDRSRRPSPCVPISASAATVFCVVVDLPIPPLP